MTDEYQIKFHGTIEDNVDVEVVFRDGTRFSATFFTIENITRLMRDYEKTGECLGGAYFWTSDMIIVKTLSENAIRSVVEDLVKSHMLGKAFGALSQLKPA